MMKMKFNARSKNLKRRIEDSPHVVKQIYRENIISLHTTSLEIISFTLVLHKMKTSLYKAGNDSYLSAPKTITDIKLEEI